MPNYSMREVLCPLSQLTFSGKNEIYAVGVIEPRDIVVREFTFVWALFLSIFSISVYAQDLPRSNNQSAESQSQEQQTHRNGVLDIALVSGLWQPSGPASILGPHPIVGAYLGLAIHRIRASAELDLRFAGSLSSRLVEYAGETISTNNFRSFYFGANLDYALIEHANFEIGFGIMPGYDVLEVVPRNYAYIAPSITIGNTRTKIGQDQSTGGKSLETFSIAFGPTFRYFTSAARSAYAYFALRVARFDYNNSGGSDLSGIGLTLYIGYGAMGSN